MFGGALTLAGDHLRGALALAEGLGVFGEG